MRKLVMTFAAALLFLAACEKQEFNPDGNYGGDLQFRQLTGAIYTTDMGCTGVNVNLFDSKDDVYLDGGPQGPNAGSGLPDGNYYVKVTAPDGNVLGFSNDPVAVVDNGEFVQCYQLVAILYTASSGFTVLGYDDTPNPGGVYKVWVSQEPDFQNNASKTDNFKVKAQVADEQYELNVFKFYDANANGKYDEGELLLTGWKVNVSDEFGYNEDKFTPVLSLMLNAGFYTVFEYMPTETSWKATTPTSVDVTLPPAVEEGEEPVTSVTVRFGNLCLGGGGGKTLGFWSNRNGQALIGADDLAMLVDLNLRNAAGAHFDPANVAAFRTWLLGGNATNMAYMLSVQLAAMALNVHNGLVDGNALVYAPGAQNANALGYISVNDLIAEADTELGLHGTAFAGDEWRSYQEALKNALDRANNNLNFVQATPCPFTFPIVEELEEKED